MAQTRAPRAGSVLRRALLLWGAGHLALGDRRGWLLLILQPLSIIAVLALASLFIDGSRWIAVFPAVVLLVGAWVGQAMHAHRLAQRAGAPAGGEFQIAILLPLVVALLSAFWLVGGARSSPAATVQHYVAAWQADRAPSAVALFAGPVDTAQLAASWAAQERHVRDLVTRAALRYGPGAGLDPERPFNSLRFEEQPGATDRDPTVIVVDVIRRQRVETNLLGFIPTATQETVRVERLGRIIVRAHPAPLPEWAPLTENPSRVWLIEEVELADGS